MNEKNKAHLVMQDRTLNSVVEISRQFLRSIQIDEDFGREDALSGRCSKVCRNRFWRLSKEHSPGRGPMEEASHHLR